MEKSKTTRMPYIVYCCALYKYHIKEVRPTHPKNANKLKGVENERKISMPFNQDLIIKYRPIYFYIESHEVLTIKEPLL